MSYSNENDDRDYEHWAGFDVMDEDAQYDEDMRIEAAIDAFEDSRLGLEEHDE